MFCLSNISTVTKPIMANGSVPDSDYEQRKPPLTATKRRNRVQNEPPKPSVMQMQRIIGAGSFRDTEPLPPLRDSDMRKTVMDLFLGQAMEVEVQKKMRETGEWLATNVEPKISSSRSRKGILMFMVLWILPIWTILLLVASGAIKLPFSNPFLDDLLM